MSRNARLDPAKLVLLSFSTPLYFDDSDRLHEAVFALAHEAEYASVESAVENAIDDDRTSLSWLEVRAIGFATRRPFQSISDEVVSYGITVQARRKVEHFRGFDANSNDRWYGPGSDPCHGGGGGSAIVGLYNQNISG